MTEQQAPFELLKTFSGLIHRHPLFITNRLDVDSYHLTFLDKQGQKLKDDFEIPDFLNRLPDILPDISEQKKTLLSMPESWRETVLNYQNLPQKIVLDVDNNRPPENIDSSHFSFACHASLESDNTNSETLLIDLEHHSQKSLTEHLPFWRNNHEILCATNVNNLDDFTLCKSQTLDLLQGQFYTLPFAKDQQKITPSTQILMELLVKLQDPNIEPEELASTINRDISLSYKLLRLINSVFFGLPREVSSTKQAIIMLGQSKIKTWATLLSLSGIDDKPAELRIIAMTRARMCELLAKYYKGPSELFFAAGLFSTLDALIDTPIEVLVEELPLAPELTEALLNKSGAVGNALSDVLNYEKGDWAAMEASSIPSEVLVSVYLDAIHWAKELNTQLQD